MLPTGSRFRALCLVAGLGPGLCAEDLSPATEEADAPVVEPKSSPAAETKEPAKSEESLLFGNGVVGIMGRGRTRISVRPRFGDLLNKDYLGVSTSVRYGLTEELELSARLDAYAGHGVGNVPAFSKAGFSGMQIGARRQLARQPEHEMGAVAGLSYSRPVGRPPPEMADAYSHIVPSIVVSRRLETRPEWTVYLRTALDFTKLETPSAQEPDDGVTRDSWTVSPGVNWERGDWSWTVETHVRSTAGLDSVGEYSLGVTPSVSWRLPAHWTPGRKGRWVLGLGCGVSYDGEKADFGVRGSLRTDFTLREFFGR